MSRVERSAGKPGDTDGVDDAPLSDSLRSTLSTLRSALHRHEQVVDFRPGARERLEQAADWLAASRGPGGFWSSVPTTALSALAIASWRPGFAAHLVSAGRWLLDMGAKGYWNNEWDAAVCLRGAQVVGLASDPYYQKRIAALCALDPDPAMWRARPHHAAQVLATLTSAGVDANITSRWTSGLADLVSFGDGPYVCGQVVHALVRHGGVDPRGLDDTLAKLANYMQKSSWSTASFFDHVGALISLGAAGTRGGEVASTVDQLFSSAYRFDGSFYQEALFTAWALLALREVTTVRKVVIDIPAFRESFWRADHALQRITAREQQERGAARRAGRLDVLHLCGLVVVLVLTVVVAVHWNSSGSLLISVVILGLLVASCTAYLAYVIRRIRRKR